MSHANHPGNSISCELKIIVTPPQGGHMSMAGYGCLVTGGHCLPCEECDNRRAAFQSQQAAMAELKDLELVTVILPAGAGKTGYRPS